jgi:tetratricopeptide (TPR) repeat protein
MAADQPDNLALSPFERNVKQTLRLYDQPERLGRESPLASPYMLGRALRDLPRPVTPAARGELLRAAIGAAAARLWGGAPPATPDAMLRAIAEVRRTPDDPRYAYVVLELRCFQRQLRPPRISAIWENEDLLLGSKSQHYRDFDAAVKRLAPLLLDELRPTLRPERPRPPAALYGYGRQAEQLAAALAAGNSVALVGPGGIGKTSLAAVALERLGGRPCFWHTLRPGFNDGVGSLLFALGAFLHELGAANVWQYLVTANGVVGDLNLAAGLLRQDLAALAASPPVLCLDDLEHLDAGGLGASDPAASPVLDLIEALRGAAPLLLISQRPLPACDAQVHLAGLGPAEIAAMWRDAGHGLDEERARRLHAFTGGNPRLLTLLLALQGEGDDPAADDAARSLLPAFQRLWLRLRPDERRALQALAVYQGYAPEELVPAASLAALGRLRLVERDASGGVTVLPALAAAIRAELPPERLAALHAAAAAARLERGEYTAAAYHFAQAGDAPRAVQAWFPHRAHALARGEADSARPIFLGLDRERLGKAERKALDLIRAELRQYAGQLAEGLAELERADWPDESEAAGRLWMLRGELENALGYPERAVSSYAEGIRVTARLVGQLTALHQRRGLLALRRRDLKASWQEIFRAEFELELMRGKLLDEEGDYDRALSAYTRARDLAEQLDDDRLRAEAERWLASIYGRREQLAEAVAHANRAIAIYERIGDRLSLEKLRCNLTSIYVQTRAFQATLDVGAPAYAFFRAIGDSYLAAATAANMAQASLYLGDLDGAARLAGEVIALGHAFLIPYARFTLGHVELARERLVAAAGHLSASMEQARQGEDHYMAAFAQRDLGAVYLRAGDVAAAAQHLQAALEAFRRFAIPSEIAATEAVLAELDAARPAGGA